MTLSTTAASALEILEDMGVENPDVTIHIHKTSPSDAATIVRRFPDWEWTAYGSTSAHQWVEARRDGLCLTIFIATPPAVERPSDAELVLEAAKGVRA